MKPTLRTAICIVLAGTFGCATVRPVAAPSAYIAQHRPDQVWVADSNGELFQLNKPTVSGDSIIGTLATGGGELMAFELTPARTVFAKQPSKSKTLQLVGVIALVAGAATYGFIVGGSGDKGCATPGMRGCPAVQ